ncbi:nuclear transport factor 2 family protein [Pseudonocardia pini]|uniref:nuclear transport factor 2 family protein n=1 Tax=Pseudonocardia pini TaxID=2758030 RepID=UPI0015EFFB66|nr:nuclear transport factor 2 family protein [Pseudonocardia pini]
MREDAIAERIAALEYHRYDAVVNGEFETFEMLAHPELRYAHSSGTVDTLDSYLAKCRSGHLAYRAVDHAEEDIVVVGDCALVHGQLRAEIVVDGSPAHLSDQTLAVWTEVTGEWLLVAVHASSLPR